MAETARAHAARRGRHAGGVGPIALTELYAIVLPVFSFIAIGYGVIWTGYLTPERAEAVSDFTFAIAVPVLLFRSLGTLELPEASPLPYWAAYFLGAFVTLALGIVITERVFGRDARAGVIGGLCASYSNTVMVGIPVLTQAFGDDGLVIGFVLVGPHLPIMMALSAILIEVSELRDGTRTGRVRIGPLLLRVLRNLLRNPLVIAMVLGIAFRFTGLPLEGIPRNVVDRIGDIAIPLALISLGMSLRGYGVSGNVRPALVLGALKLFAMPAIVYVLAVHVFDLGPLATAGAIVCAACPTGVNAYLIAARFQTGLALSANTITLTTVASVVSFTLWLWILGI